MDNDLSKRKGLYFGRRRLLLLLFGYAGAIEEKATTGDESELPIRLRESGSN